MKTCVVVTGYLIESYEDKIKFHDIQRDNKFWVFKFKDNKWYESKSKLVNINSPDISRIQNLLVFKQYIL